MHEKLNSSVEEEKEQEGKVGKVQKLKDEKLAPKEQSAQDVAEIMAANMTANMENPNFLHEQELLRDKVRRKINKKRNERKG